MSNTLIVSIAVMSIPWGFIGYGILKSKYPGRGLQVIGNMFKESLSFEKALEALKDGHRIRRKSERQGYTKLVIVEGKKQKEKFGSYWVSDNDKVNDHCSFSIEDVLANDWIIDEDS